MLDEHSHRKPLCFTFLPSPSLNQTRHSAWSLLRVEGQLHMMKMHAGVYLFGSGRWGLSDLQGCIIKVL